MSCSEDESAGTQMFGHAAFEQRDARCIEVRNRLIQHPEWYVARHDSRDRESSFLSGRQDACRQLRARLDAESTQDVEQCLRAHLATHAHAEVQVLEGGQVIL